MKQLKNTSISFKGQHFFIGLDVHKKNWKVIIRINNTQIKQFSMDPSPEQLLKFLRKNYPDGIYHTVYEAGFLKWLESIHFEYEPDNQYLRHYIQNLQSQRILMKEVLLQIRGHCKENKILKCIRSVTGIGIISTFTIYAELVDMKRFKDLDHLASYVGLVPFKDSTGDKKGIKGLTPRYSRYVRYLLVECAWRAIGSDPAMTAAYAEFTSRMTKQKAIIKIAKKLLNRIRYVWLNEKTYVTGVVR